LNCLENRDELFHKLENEPNSHRYDDYLDSVEEKILEMKHIRIEYRWLEIERLRSLYNWYPFYSKTVIGESSDDCIDPDRLVSFEDDISFILIDLNEDTEYFKFKLLCMFFKYLNIVSWNENIIDIKLLNNSDELNLVDLNMRFSLIQNNEDLEFMQYLNEKLPFLKKTTIDNQNILFQFGLLENMFEYLFDPEIKPENLKMLKLLLKNTIDFIRNCLSQLNDKFNTVKYKTCLIILKWKFEFNLIQLLTNRVISEEINQDFEDYFNPNLVKKNLIHLTKLDLEKNRLNHDLWKQYGILKWLLNNEKFLNNESKKIDDLKETRKVFDNLILTSSISTTNDSINMFSLCADYVELELGIYYKQYDIETNNSISNDLSIGFTTIFIQNGIFDLNYEIRVKKFKKEDLIKFSEMLVKNCLNKEIESKSKAKTTFQIGITGSTRLLLIKRDFQNEYIKQLNDSNSNNDFLIQKKLFHFHRVYSLFLICVDDLEKLIELNDSSLKQSTTLLLQSKLIEFYLSILNYLYFQQIRITKFMYKAKLFAIINTIMPLNQQNNSISCNKSLIRLLLLSFIRFKLSNSQLFCSNLIENNDIDLILKQMGLSLTSDNSSSVWLSLIFTYINKLERILNSIETNDSKQKINIGVHNEIRRLFENALKYNPKSFQIWFFYLKFELKYGKNELSKNNLLYIYYQSIRNLPYFKVNEKFYLKNIFFKRYK
jgi:hypothetical protein